MKLLSQRARLGVAGALALAGLAGGTGLADAAPAAVPGTTAAHVRATAPDVGVPPEGLAPNALVTTPDGTKVRASALGAFGDHRSGRDVAATGADKSVGIAGYGSRYYARVIVTNPRVRAWVPNGTVLGLATGVNGLAHCKIPASDGHTWAWVNFDKVGVGAKRVIGWMRTDLFQIYYGYSWESPGRYLPWC